MFDPSIVFTHKCVGSVMLNMGLVGKIMDMSLLTALVKEFKNSKLRLY